MNYYSHNIGDFAVETKYMTFEQKGLYIDMVDRYLSTGKPLDSHWVSTIKRLASEGAVDAVLMLCFEERDGLFYSERCEKIIADYEAMAEKNRRNAQKRVKKTVVEEGKEPTGESAPIAWQPTGNPLAAQSPLTNNHKPITNNHKEEKKETKKKSAAPKAPKAAPVEKPDDVSDQVWTEWLALRKAKRAQVTPFILDRIRKQAEQVPAKYGFTFEDALLMMIDGQWTGFEAEWVVNRLSRTGGRATAAPQGFTRELSAEERARNPGFGITQEDIDEALTPLPPEEIAALSPHQDDVPPFDEALTLH